MPRTPVDPLDRALALHDRAVALCQQGRIAPARRAATRAHDLFARHAGRAHPDVASTLDTLAMIDIAAGDLPAAIRRLRRAIAILDGYPRVPVARQLCAQSLERLGDALRRAGRYTTARTVYQRALRASRGAFGAGAVEHAVALNGFGILCKFGGWFAEGVRAYRRALAIAEAHDAVDLAVSVLHNLGGIEHARDRFAAAEPYARRGLALRVARYGDDDPGALDDRSALAAIVLDLGRRDEAESMLRDLLARFEALRGPDDYEVAVVCHNLAGALDAARADESVALYRRALAIKRAVLGAGHPDLVVTMHNLATLRAAQGDVRESAALHRRALALSLRTMGPRHPTTRACREALRARSRIRPSTS